LASAVELSQLGDDEGKKRSISNILTIQSGFSGWTARIATAGRARVGFKISKRLEKEEALLVLFSLLYSHTCTLNNKKLF
jgi:hypothetical protein